MPEGLLGGPHRILRVNEYDIRILPYNQLPYAWWVPAKIGDYPRDSDGVILYELDGVF